jgi:NTE family protein
MRTPRFISWALLLLSLGGCSYPVNPKLIKYDSHVGYRYANLNAAPGNSESLFVILTFSGGGTRAAALSYGVMEKLSHTKIQWEGAERRLLDEVDVISSVSGGSFTAAYYGLFREELFDPEKFEKEFLYKDIQGELVASLFNPINWFRLASPTFGRIELAAELYDRKIFRGKTFDALLAQRLRPYILLNATDITVGSPFTFVQDQFDPLCSDLAGVPVSRAVAASSNFPIAFTPLIVNNYAGSCQYQPPGWIAEAEKDLLDNPPRFNRARIARSYLDAANRKYVHLLDGGVSDNIGLRGPLTALTSNDPSWSLVNRINMRKVKKVVVIVVDARTDPKTEIDQSPRSPGLTTLVDIISSVPMSNYSFDTVQKLFDEFNAWHADDANYAACQQLLQKECPSAQMPNPPPEAVGTYGVYVGFDQIKDVTQREAFLNLPTTFALPSAEVNKLRKIGPQILGESQGFQKLCAELHCQGS